MGPRDRQCWSGPNQHGATAIPSGRSHRPLPAAAAARLRALREQVDDIWVIGRELTDKRSELQAQRQRAEARIRQLAAEGYSDPEHPSVAQATADRDRAGQEIAAVNERAARLDERSPAQLVRGLEEWLRRLPADLEITEHPDPVKPSLAPRETAGAAIDRTRQTLAELRADLHAVQSAPQPSATVKAKIRQEVEELAARGAPDVLRYVEVGGPLQWPATDIMARIDAFVAMPEGTPPVAGFASHQAVDTHSLFAWLFREQLIEKLEAEVDELSDDAASLTDSERAERERQIRDRILATERFEEALVAQAGDAVPRRPDADPRAVLGLSSDWPGRPE